MNRPSRPLKFAALHLTYAALLCLLLAATPARAQEKDAPKLEVGAQFSSLELNPPETLFGPGTQTTPGFGGRVTYNLNDHVAFEAEVNFFPRDFDENDSSFQLPVFGRAVQGQFGLKAGRRFRRFGVFAKARPGFVSFSKFPVFRPATFPFNFEFTRERRTFASADLGGVLELYPSRRVLARFDAGDTIIRYGERRDFITTPVCCSFGTVPADYRHNFQLSAGVAFRFLDPAGDGAGAPPAGAGAGRRGDVPTVEVGVQYSSLHVSAPKEIAGGFPIILSARVRDPLAARPDRVPPVSAEQLTPAPELFSRGNFVEPGVGARLTVNLNRSVAVETVANFFTKENFSESRIGGRAIQGLFGVKVGRRFDTFGLFAKARPGFISYSDVEQLQDTRTITVGTSQFVLGLFGTERKTYFNADIGGVLELYPSRRVVARFDAGDTIIRYDATQTRTFSFFGSNIADQPAETRHNFQFTAGIGYRF